MTDTLFDAELAERLKQQGMQRAADARSHWLAVASRLAYELAQSRGTVTSDDVALAMEKAGRSYERLGNARGSVFKRLFEWTGEVVPSQRPSSHGRMIKVWRLKAVWQ